jgi:nucleoside-diphosphate-sugar epimerase
MTKILITGGAGFIGYHLGKRLLDAGCHVELMDNMVRGVLDRELEALIQHPRVRFIQADMREPEALKNLGFDYHYIYHLAAIIGVAHILKRPFQVLSDNATMMFNVLALAREQAALQRLVFTSTSEVYAGALKYFTLPIPTPESTPLAITDLKEPRTSYMLSKIYGEALCHQSRLPFTIIRPHNFYGPRMGLSHVIPELLKRAHEAPFGGKLAVYSMSHRRTFCFIEDAVEMIRRLAEAPEGEGGTFNVGNQTPEVTIRELAELIVKVVDKPLDLISQPETPGSPSRRCPDMSKTLSLTGYRSRFNLTQGLELTYRWYRDTVFSGKGIFAI